MKKLILSLLCVSSLVLNAQEEEKGEFTLSGTVDVYGTTNFTEGSGTPGILIASPENANAFGLGSANTVFAYEKGKAGVVADLAFGPKADDANLAGAINQLYAYYNVNDKLTVTAGQFNTFLGYEVINPSANFNYTVSYLFNAGPFSHTGLKLDYAVSEDLSLMLAVTNGHAVTSADGNFTDATQFGAQVGYKGQYLNIIAGAIEAGGPRDWFFIDYTGGFDLTESFYVGINAAYANSGEADSGYQGVALYLQNTFSDKFALGLRPELFSLNGASEESVTAVTLTANTNLTSNLKLITDLRFDSSDDMIIEAFPNKTSTSTFTMAAVYSF
ncbi:outer membrane beta-barrel protein [uncultured Polaribacter sp.]|uniref:outer membrane beta-barrel protein n=1 Tax=uncultured Polaribacter sp. TaxID=174711 RepID=UPI002639DEFD|nr:outer membrane beta-barrel protein [uncultured Polaribacter sp.]